MSESTRADILGHSHAGMTAHYSMAHLFEIRAGLELTTDERHANNVSLASIIAQRRAARIALKPLRKENGLGA